MNPPPLANSPLRRHDFDALRGLAMLLGILLHTLLSFIGIPIWPVQDSQPANELYASLLHAIHGFRLPLFFLISGYFTMMLWKKRGSLSLIKNRLLRIALPMVATTLITWPLLIGVWILNHHTNPSQNSTSSPPSPESYTPTNINQPDKSGMTPLAWAAVQQDTVTMQQLLNQGADLNCRNSDQATPLIVATFFGKSESVQWLVDNGADLNAKNIHGSTAADVLYTDWQITIAIAQILEIPITQQNWQEGRELIAHTLTSKQAYIPTLSTSKKSPPRWISSWKSIAQFPIFHHAWFLYYLLWFVALFLLILPILNKLPPTWITTYKLWLWATPITFICQFFMRDTFGADTATGILPWPPTFIYYITFFLVGALSFNKSAGMETTWGTRWWLPFALSVIIFFATNNLTIPKYHPAYYWIFSAGSVAYSWLMVFAWVGFFRKYCTSSSPIFRYLSDASYWLYLAHLPVVMYLQWFVKDWQFHSAIKITFIVSTTVITLLISYHLFVRFTRIGTLLNGRKQKTKHLHNTN